MANFKTHLLTASAVSGVAAIACMKAGVAPAAETPVLFGLGALGGLLPDIDSDNSVPIRISFHLLAFFLAFLTMFAFVGRYTVVELAALWLAVFVGVRYVVLELFIAFTTHRGAFHSVLAAAFFGLLTVSLSYRILGRAYESAWLYGVFVGLGYLIHLLLDELFSVDLLNQRIKRSFGSGFKIVSLKYWPASLLLALAVAAVYTTVPSPARFSAAAWHKLESRFISPAAWLIPSNGHWFRNLGSTVARSLGRIADSPDSFREKPEGRPRFGGN